MTTIYHNPACSTSRSVLAMLREHGIEPTVINYLASPPDRATLVASISAMGITPRELLRSKEPACQQRGLDDQPVADAELIDAMLAEPILINRPIVVTPRGTRLCRPAERVLALLAAAD